MPNFYQPIALAFALAALRFAGPLALAETPSSAPRIGVVDQIVFGDAASEQAHGFAGTSTRAETAAALGEPARVSLPKEPADYYGGDLTFTLHTDPTRQNYFTVKYWGSDVNGGQKALLYIEGEQLGYRHLDDYEALNHGTEAPSFRGENIKKRVNLAWKVARRGSTYDVLRASSEAGPFTPVATGLTRTTWTDPTVEYGQRYAYTVVATARDGRSGPPTAAVSFAPVDDTLPAPWKGEDIGNGGAEGDDGLREGVFAVRGSGADVWGGADEFRFVQQPTMGDHSVVAHVRRQQDTGSWVKSGIMLRESLAPGARNVFLFQTPGEGLCLQTRVSGGITNQTKIVKSFTRTPWLKLTRRGDVVTAFASPDGHDWTEVGSATMAFPDTVHAGLAVCAHARGAINLTEFDHVEVQP